MYKETGRKVSLESVQYRTDETGYSNLTLHRADYQRILYNAATKAGATIEFGKRVVTIDFDAPSVTLENGLHVPSDLIIAADGIASFLDALTFFE